MNGAGSYFDLFLAFLLGAGGVILVSGLVDVGLGGARQHCESIRRWLSRPVSRQKPKSVVLPPR